MYNEKDGLALLEQIEEAKEFIVEQEFENAIDVLDKALDIIGEMEEMYAEETVKICKLQGLCYRKNNMFEEGIEVLNKAENLCRKLYLKRNDIAWRRELAICYMNKAIIYDSQERVREAIELYKSAIELFSDLNDNESRVKAMLSLGVAYGKINNYQEVKALYKQALNIIGSDYLLENYRVLFYKMEEDILKQKEKK